MKVCYTNSSERVSQVQVKPVSQNKVKMVNKNSQTAKKSQ